MTLPSEIKELKNKIRELKEQKYEIGSVILHEVTRIINTADYLSEEQKTHLLNEIWYKRKGEHP